MDGPTGEPRSHPVRLRHPPGEVFVGREPELARLLARLHRDADASCAGALVRGESGIGKSRLVAEAIGRAPPRRVLRGRADPIDRYRAFAAVADALGPLDPAARPVDARLADLLAAPTVDDGVGPGLRTRLVDAYVAAVEARADTGAVALILEDLQWADPATVAVIRELTDPSPGRDVVVLATSQPSHATGDARLLDELVVDRRLDLVELGPLPPDQVRALIEASLGRTAGPGLLAQLERTGGNPLYAGELAVALAEQGSLHVVEGAPRAVVEVRHASPPPSLRVTILRRLSELPEPTLRALRLAALLGATFDVRELAAGLELSVPVVAEHLREAERAGWIEPTGARLGFRHDLVRDVLHDDQAAPLRRALHRHLADRLVAVDAPVTAVARHLLVGATPPDPSAAAWLHAAGRQALSREPDVAVDLLEGAEVLAPTPGRARDRILLDLGIARCWSGRVRDGELVLRELLSRPHDPRVDGPATLALARSVLLSGDSGDALEVLEAGRGRTTASGSHAALWAESAIASMLRGDLDQARAAVRAVQNVPEADDESRCVALGVTCALDALEGRFEDAIAAGRDALEVARSSSTRETVRRPPHLFLGSVLLDADRFEDGWRTLHEGRRISEDLGAVWDLPLVHLVAARGRYLTGALDQCAAEAETALSLAVEVGTRVLEVWGHALGAHVHLHHLDLDLARAALAAGEAAVGRVGVEVRGVDWLLWARARLAELDGQPELARALLGAVWDGHRSRGLLSERRLFGPELVRLHLAIGARDDAEEVAAAVDDLAAVAGTTSAAAAAAYGRGLIARDAELLVEAAEATAGVGCVTEHVDQALAAADRLVEDVAPAAAIGWYERARDAAREAGLEQGRRRAEAGLRRLGRRSGARGPRQRRRTGWDALTPTEQTVAELAARGLSNPAIGDQLYISRRTVQTHLSHVYAKLGVRSRVELARWVAERSAPAD